MVRQGKLGIKTEERPREPAMFRGIGLTVALLAAFLCSICSGRQAIFARGQSSKERLVGVTVVGETVLNIISVGLPDFDVNVLVPNATEVGSISFQQPDKQPVVTFVFCFLSLS